MPSRRDLTDTGQLNTAGTIIRIRPPFLITTEKYVITGLIFLAWIIDLLVNLLCKDRAAVSVICTDIFSAGVFLSTLSYIRMRFTESDDWVGLFLLSVFITAVAAMTAISWALFA